MLDLLEFEMREVEVTTVVVDKLGMGGFDSDREAWEPEWYDGQRRSFVEAAAKAAYLILCPAMRRCPVVSVEKLVEATARLTADLVASVITATPAAVHAAGIPHLDNETWIRVVTEGLDPEGEAHYE